MKPIPLFADFYFETHESDGILIRERLFLAAFAEKKKKVVKTVPHSTSP